jgi:hypothetical protein
MSETRERSTIERGEAPVKEAAQAGTLAPPVLAAPVATVEAPPPGA